MSQRGTYRSIHDAILHDSVFLGFSGQAKLMFFILKLTLGASGIDVIYTGALTTQVGDSSTDIREALDELGRAGWIRFEEISSGVLLLWIVRGLEFEPNLNLNNANIRKGISRHVEGLPKSTLVREFCDRYELPLPKALEPPSSTDGRRLERPSEQEKGKREEVEGEDRKKRKGDGRGKRENNQDLDLSQGEKSFWENDDRWSKVEQAIRSQWPRDKWSQVEEAAALATTDSWRSKIYAVASDIDAAARAGEPVDQSLAKAVLIKAINSETS